MLGFITFINNIFKTNNKKFTKNELAKFFGVSITSINNWINQGRFIGIKKNNTSKNIRISENIMWKSSNGQEISIKDVVKMWEENKKEINDSIVKNTNYQDLIYRYKYDFVSIEKERKTKNISKPQQSQLKKLLVEELLKESRIVIHLINGVIVYE